MFQELEQLAPQNGNLIVESGAKKHDLALNFHAAAKEVNV